MNRNTRRLGPALVAALALVCLAAAPQAMATEVRAAASSIQAQATLDRQPTLTDSFDQDARRIIRESQDDLRVALNASLREEFTLALASRRPLTARR